MPRSPDGRGGRGARRSSRMPSREEGERGRCDPALSGQWRHPVVGLGTVVIVDRHADLAEDAVVHPVGDGESRVALGPRCVASINPDSCAVVAEPLLHEGEPHDVRIGAGGGDFGSVAEPERAQGDGS